MNILPEGYYNSHECPDWGPCFHCSEIKRREDEEREAQIAAFEKQQKKYPEFYSPKSYTSEPVNMGKYKVLAETEKSIYCESRGPFEVSKKGIKRWGERPQGRWIPRSQIKENENSLRKNSHIGEENHLWVSRWLSRKWQR